MYPLSINIVHLFINNINDFIIMKCIDANVICHVYKYLSFIYTHVQGRIQDLAQEGDKLGAKRPKFFLSPPELLRGGTEFELS